jgi:hypothetical protein
VEAIIDPLRSLDWEDIDAVEHATRKAYTALAEETEPIRDALLMLPERPELLRLCEHYDILDKIVLHDDESGVRLRLHVFLPGHFDRPHNHRWSYASTILRGDYRHYLFGNAELDDTVEPAGLKAFQVRQEQVGNTYALHHTMVHAVVAQPYTVSMVLRGPAVKDRFLVMDRKTGKSWWQYGARDETADSAQQKRMSPERLSELTGWLRSWGLF